MRVPFLDLMAQYRAYQGELDQAMRQVFESCAFAGGPFVDKFEGEFARFCECDWAVGVGSGTEALRLTLHTLGVGPGDEVITVPNSFIATAEAISWCGAKPVFVDVRPDTYTLDPDRLEAAISARTKALIPVHLFGQTADMDPIAAVAAAHDLIVIEDACQAHGARYQGRRAGSLGWAGCFSFYPGKNLGAYGEAGAVTTNDANLAERLRLLRDHGQSQRYRHQLVGCNSRMDGLQAAVLTVKLRYLESWNQARSRVAQLYNRLLTQVPGVSTPQQGEYRDHIHHVYAIRTPNRDGLARHLLDHGIGCGIHYPVPIHLQPAYLDLGLGEGSFPVAERCAREFLSLPIYPELTEDQVNIVVRHIAEFVSGQADHLPVNPMSGDGHNEA